MGLINGKENGTQFVDIFEFYFYCVVGVINSTDLTEKINKSDKTANFERTVH